MLRGVPKKIVVIGCGGAGKSAFSRRLGEALELPVIHLDSFFWKPGWEETPKGEWERAVGELIRGDEWIMDGNYGGTMDMRLAASGTAIFLDMPRRLWLRRVVGRRLRYAGKHRPDMAPGCPERLEWQFLKYVWSYPKSRRPGILKRLESLPEGKEAFVLRSPGESRLFAKGRRGDVRSDNESGRPLLRFPRVAPHRRDDPAGRLLRRRRAFLIRETFHRNVSTAIRGVEYVDV